MLHTIITFYVTSLKLSEVVNIWSKTSDISSNSLNKSSFIALDAGRSSFVQVFDLVHCVSLHYKIYVTMVHEIEKK